MHQELTLATNIHKVNVLYSGVDALHINESEDLTILHSYIIDNGVGTSCINKWHLRNLIVGILKVDVLNQGFKPDHTCLSNLDNRIIPKCEVNKGIICIKGFLNS